MFKGKKISILLSTLISILITGGIVYAITADIEFKGPAVVTINEDSKQELIADILEVMEIEEANLAGLFPVLKNVTALNSTTTTATSSPIDIAGTKKVTPSLTRPVNGEGGTSDFSVWASTDGSNYFQFNKLIDNVSNTNGEQLTRLSTTTLSATTTIPVIVSLDLVYDSLQDIKVVVNETTDGSHSANVKVEF